jgi:hypothetical protein
LRTKYTYESVHFYRQYNSQLPLTSSCPAKFAAGGCRSSTQERRHAVWCSGGKREAIPSYHVSHSSYCLTQCNNQVAKRIRCSYMAIHDTCRYVLPQLHPLCTRLPSRRRDRHPLDTRSAMQRRSKHDGKEIELMQTLVIHFVVRQLTEVRQSDKNHCTLHSKNRIKQNRKYMVNFTSPLNINTDIFTRSFNRTCTQSFYL